MIRLVLSRREDVKRLANFAFAEMDEILRKAWNTPNHDWEGWTQDLEIALTNESERVLNIVLSNDEGKDILAGFVWFDFTEDNSIWLTALVVASQFQNLGIGSRVMSILEEEARKNGKDRIELGVQKVNVKAIEFYKRKGFQICEDIDYAGTLIMQKVIADRKSPDTRLYT
ncbi:MAG: GNAT family N-acetyltransferase [Candidatus Hodarchaeota archaeon]